ncbi:MAG: GerMN domain-containing protein [Thermacetogeniaceae bacterium]
MLTRRLAWKLGMGLFVLALTVLLTLTTGCWDQEKAQQNAQQSQENEIKIADTAENKENSETKPDISAEPKEEKEKITLYFGDQDAMYLIAEERVVVKGNKKLEEVVIEELIQGPKNPDLFQTVPKEAKLISLEVVDGVAYVNFNQDFQTKHWGGSAGEAMTLYSITNSLAELPEIDKVQFLLEGKKQEAILGHADTTEPLAPNYRMVKNN